MTGSRLRFGGEMVLGTGLAKPRSRAARMARLVVASGFAAGLAGCATLPVSGPTGSEIIKQSQNTTLAQPFPVIELTGMADLPVPPALRPLLHADSPPPTDLIGIGDVLDIEIYEVGVTLFAGSHSGTTVNEAGAPPVGSGAQAEHLSDVRVHDDGHIRVPYVGELRADGHTTDELALMIRNGLRGKSQDPQVSVSIAQNIAGSVIVGGEIAKPGRLELNTNRETLSDAIALSGGYHGDAKDLVARVTRRGAAADYRLADILSGPDRDLQVSPGDRIEVVRAPMSFSVLGAPGKVDVVPFATPQVDLAEAVAAAGGANPYFGDAKAIFVFRFVTGDDGKAKPVVYHLNMMRPGAYFLSQRFAMQDKDVVYVGNASSNQPSKLIQLISQLFSPIVAVQSGLISAGVVK